MQSSRDALDKAELKQPKFCREADLFDRRANIINHAFLHRCSGYCLKEKRYKKKLDPTKPIEEQMGTYKECRIGFGRELKFDSTEENNKTRGKERVDEPFIKALMGICCMTYLVV